jgi:2-polyprenyl-3-methyl-5-hydroxy-6-metoxy-1,4-benzoquinol methylase
LLVVAILGLTGKYEKFSSRRPFKRINEEHVLKVLHNAGARCILDIGCGVGNLVCYLETKGYDVHGITINPQEVKSADHKNIRLFDIQRELGESDFVEEQFDAVLSFDCFEHLENPLTALKNVNKLLKNDGIFISYIPPSRWTECDYHIVVYNRRQYRWLLNLAGFDLEETEGRHYFSNRGVTYYARKKVSDSALYPGVLA